MKKLIFIFFAILFFFVPLVLWPYTSEVFEFNKMVLVYILTSLIVGAWAVRCINERKLIFRRTILDTPLLVFIGSQFISTILSIDPLTSWLGYYSRFNGGFLSTLSYSILYWAFVSNFEKDDVLKLINVSLLPGTILVALYGVAEHFGIDKNLWVQDVQSRVFSTLGQPNWLAAWLVAIIPLTWSIAISNFQLPFSSEFSKSKIFKFIVPFGLSTLFFWTLIFTKSRSGLLGFGVAFAIYWVGYFWMNRKSYSKQLPVFAIISSSLLVISLISGTEFTPSLSQLLRQQSTVNSQQLTVAPAGPALETGGTESGTIRKIVWKGAVQVWLHYPIFGTGVETFAYSYYKYRPPEHNLTSEWDFIYNKAHNEFLNVAANTGTVGLISYLILIGFSIYVFIKKPSSEHIALLAGYVSLSVTNFFGFSVVPTQLQFYLFPAFAIALANLPQTTDNKQIKSLSGSQKTASLVVVSCVLVVVFAIGKYWYADTLYNKGYAYNKALRPDAALPYLTHASSLEPSQPLYINELANSYATIALSYNKQKDTDNTKRVTDLAIAASDKAASLSPANVIFKRSRFGVFIMLSTIDPNYLINARDTLIDAVNYAPTDAKILYNLGLTYARTGQADQALEALRKTVDLKPNYRDARLAYAILLINAKQNAEAKTQLKYILTNIDPNDPLAKQTLEGIK